MSASLDALDPALRTFVHTVCSEGARLADGRSLDWPQQRAIAETVRTPWRAGGPEMAATTTHRIAHGADGFEVRVHRPQGVTTRAPALVYLHGGGWVVGGLDSHDFICFELATALQVLVIAIDYRLAPEHPFPAAIADVCAAWCCTRSWRSSAERIRMPAASSASPRRWSFWSRRSCRPSAPMCA